MAKYDKKSNFHNLASRNFDYVPKDFNEFTTALQNDPKLADRLHSDMLKLEQQGYIKNVPKPERIREVFGVSTSTPASTTTQAPPPTQATPPVQASGATFPAPAELNKPIGGQPLPNVGTPQQAPEATPTELPKMQDGTQMPMGGGLGKGQFQITDTTQQQQAPALPPVQQVQAQTTSTGTSGAPVMPDSGVAMPQAESTPFLPQEAYDKPFEYTRKLIGTVVRDIPKYAFGEPLKGAAQASRWLWGSLGIPQPEKIEDDWLYKAGQLVNDAGEYVMTQGMNQDLPMNHRKGAFAFNEEEASSALAPQVSSAMAQVISLIGTGGGSSTTRVPQLTEMAVRNLSGGLKYITPAKYAIIAGASKIADKPGLIASLQGLSQLGGDAARSWDEANQMSRDEYVNSKILNEGAKRSDAEETYDLLKGKTRDEVIQSTFPLALMLAQTEKIPLEAMFKWVPEQTFSRLGNIVATSGVGLATEAITEGAQTGIENIGINMLYDKTRETFTGMEDASKVGGTSGFVFGVFIGALKKRKQRIKQKVEAGEITQAEAIKETEEINKTEEFVNDKVDAFEASVAMNIPANKATMESPEAQTFFDSNEASLTNPITTMPAEVETVFDKITNGILISDKGLHDAYQWVTGSVKATLENQTLSPAEKGATLNILNGMLSDIDKANTEGQKFVEEVETASVQDRVPAVREGVAILPEGQNPSETVTTTRVPTPSITKAREVKQKTNVLPSSGEVIVTPEAKPVSEPVADAVSEPASKAEVVNTEKYYATIGGMKYPVSNMQEASEKQQAFFNKMIEGREDTPYVQVNIENEKGEVVAHISQNGNVWAGKSWSPGAKPLYEPTSPQTQTTPQTETAETIVTPEAKPVSEPVAEVATEEVVTEAPIATEQATETPTEDAVQVEATTEANPALADVESTAKALEEVIGKDVKPETNENLIELRDRLKKAESERTNFLISGNKSISVDEKMKDEISSLKKQIDKEENKLAEIRKTNLQAMIDNGQLKTAIDNNIITAENARLEAIGNGVKVPEWLQSIVDDNKSKKETSTDSILNRTTDFLGDEKADFMIPKTDESVRDKDTIDYLKGHVKRAIDNGRYEKAIAQGRMTANDAKVIIESFGLKVPVEIKQLLTPDKNESETTIQEKPLLEGVRDGGTEGKAGQESAQLRTEETGKPQATKEGEVGDKNKSIIEHLPKGGEIKGVTEINVLENGEEVTYGTKTRKTTITVKGLSVKDIRQELKFEKELLERSKKDASNFNESEIRSAKGLTNKEKEDAIKMHNQSLLNNEQVEKIVIPFYEKHLEIAEQATAQTSPTAKPSTTSTQPTPEAKPKSAMEQAREARRQAQAKAKQQPTQAQRVKAREAYFKPGAIVESYGGGKDRVIEYNQDPNDPSKWSVTVQQVDAKGNPVGEPRTHKTEPSDKEYKRAGVEVVPEKTSKQMFEDVMNGLKTEVEEDTKAMKSEDNDGIILRSGINLSAALAIPRAAMKTMGFGDKFASRYTTRIADATARAMKRGMRNSNAALANAVNISQGIIRNVGRQGGETDVSRRAMGEVRASAGRAMDFYNAAVESVNADPQALMRVQQVLDPDLYEGQVSMGIIPRVEYADLNTEEQRLYDLLRANLDMIHEWHHDNGFISDKTYEKFKGNYSPRFWEENYESDMDAETQAMYQQMGKALNKDYIKMRKDLDEMGRDADDAVQDPVFGVAMRMAQMLRNQAIMDYAKQLDGTTSVWDGAGDPPPGYVLLDGKRYGSLNGKYVSRDVADDFKGYFLTNFFMNELYKLSRLYDGTKIMQFEKKIKTIYDPIVFAGNIGSNFYFAFQVGVDPFSYGLKLNEANKSIDARDADYKYLLEEGILGTDLFTSDIQARSESVRASQVAQPVVNQSIAGKALSNAMESIEKWYGKVDDIGKLAAFKALVEQGVSREDAARRVFEGFQNYGQVGRYYDFAAKAPVFGSRFIKFKGDLLRTKLNNIKKRPLTFVATYALLNAVAMIASKASGEDEELRRAREAMPYKPKVPMPKYLEKYGIRDIPLTLQIGETEVNMARLFSPDYVYDTGDEGFLGNVEEITSYLPFQLQAKEEGEAGIPVYPRMNDILIAPIVQLWNDRDFRNKPIMEKTGTKYREGREGSMDKLFAASNFLGNAYIPFYGKGHSLYSAALGTEDMYDRKRSITQSLLNMAVKVKQMDRPEVVRAYTRDIDYLLGRADNIEKEITSQLNKSEKDLEQAIADGDEIKQEKIVSQTIGKIADLEDRKAKTYEKAINKYGIYESIAK